MLGRKAIGIFVKVDGVEALQKDMPEEFIINSVLSWKICKQNYKNGLLPDSFNNMPAERDSLSWTTPKP